MNCPFCNREETRVIDSRLVNDGYQTRRRRECLACSERFTTYEIVELAMPRIIKRDGKRVAFDETKLRNGIQRALEKRAVSVQIFEQLIERLKQSLRSSGEREITSQTLGEWAMQSLSQVDEVAYVRFASVYRQFQDVQAFHEEVQRIQQNKVDP